MRTDYPRSVVGNMSRILKKEQEPYDQGSLVVRQWQIMRVKLLQGQILQGLAGCSKGLGIYPEDNVNPWQSLEQGSDTVRTMCRAHLGYNVENKLKKQAFQKKQCWCGPLEMLQVIMALLLVEWVGKEKAALALCILHRTLWVALRQLQMAMRLLYLRGTALSMPKYVTGLSPSASYQNTGRLAGQSSMQRSKALPMSYSQSGQRKGWQSQDSPPGIQTPQPGLWPTFLCHYVSAPTCWGACVCV